MKQYEYKIVEPSKLFKLGKSTSKVEKEWNELGNDGWKFVNFDYFSRAVFIREKK